MDSLGFRRKVYKQIYKQRKKTDHTIHNSRINIEICGKQQLDGQYLKSKFVGLVNFPFQNGISFFSLQIG